MSRTLSLCGTSSILTTDYFPPIDLNGVYECGLIDFITYNSIPNVDETNNLFYFGDKVYTLPIGSYEISDISDFMESILLAQKHTDLYLNIRGNNNTLSTEITGSEIIDFSKERSIGPLLGFKKRTLEPDVTHYSDHIVNISKVNSIRVECNIISGSYFNDKPTHTIYEFSPDVEPGYKINQCPRNVIYLPINVQQVNTLVVKIVDQNGDLINFRGEDINIRLHLRKTQ